jgi:hypothetical protein
MAAPTKNAVFSRVRVGDAPLRVPKPVEKEQFSDFFDTLSMLSE